MMMIPTKHSIALWSIRSTMRTIIRPRDGAPTDDLFGFQFVKMDYITGYLLACGEGSERSIFIIFCSFCPSHALRSSLLLWSDLISCHSRALRWSSYKDTCALHDSGGLFHFIPFRPGAENKTEKKPNL